MKQKLQNAMLIGMFISKYDKQALDILGFKNFAEAYNVIGLTLGIKPLTIRNYRDEFDPVFPNPRIGYRNRPMVKSRKEMLDEFNDLSIEDFINLVKGLIYENPDVELLKERIEIEDDVNSTFAKRLITGQAAEQYFRDNYKNEVIFEDAKIEDTTKLGCGFDFKMNFRDKYYAIEVKGLSQNTGNIGITEKEFRVANVLKDNYYIYVVKNFIKKPESTIFSNPIYNPALNFTKQENTIIQLSWNARV